MSTKIAVVGCGEIGSRHLQALRRLDGEVELFAVDPSSASLARAAERASEVSSRPITKLGGISSLPTQLDLVIIATSAGHRLAAIRDLLSACNTPYLLLEKVLFQAEEDYAAAARLLREKAVSAWVNCPRRAMRCFLQLRQIFHDGGPVHLRVEGTGWGLACNAIHFIDLLAMYTAQTAYTASTISLHPIIHESKRDGCIELTGEFRGEFGDGSTFSLVCEKGASVAYTTTIENDRYRITFETPGSTAETTDLTDPRSTTSEAPFSLEPQSNLTHEIVMTILRGDLCPLPTLEESTQLHLPMITAMKEFVEHLEGRPLKRLPIT